MSWRMRVVHTTGYVYDAPVMRSFNEARLTPRADSRQNVILNRVETVPSTRSYRYVDYWGTTVTAFDLHAPHTELEVTGSSVVETEPFASPEEELPWERLRSEPVVDRYDELLTATGYVPRDRRLGTVARQLTRGVAPAKAVVRAAE
ncbi:transglutaminase family protein, partial [Nocardia nova]|nr:transglutaminase family protein [Nocardia nova]